MQHTDTTQGSLTCVDHVEPGSIFLDLYAIDSPLLRTSEMDLRWES